MEVLILWFMLWHWKISLAKIHIMEPLEISKGKILKTIKTPTITGCWIICQKTTGCETIGTIAEENSEKVGFFTCYLLGIMEDKPMINEDKEILKMMKLCPFPEYQEPASERKEFVMMFYGNTTKMPYVVRESNSTVNWTIALYFTWSRGEIIFTFTALPIQNQRCEAINMYEFNGYGYVNFQSNQAGSGMKFNLTKNEWNHVVISYSGVSNILTLYINGSKVNDYDKSSNKLPVFNKMQLVLGNDVDLVSNECVPNDPSQGFTGAIRGFNVWNKKLADERVMDIFKGVDEKNDMLIAWSEFNSTDDVKKEFYMP